MVPDHDTNAVFVSGLLRRRHLSITQALRAAFGDRLRIIPGAKDIWCRDFMPIQLAQRRFIEFRYAPDYLKGYRDIRTDDGDRLLGLTKNCVRSDLVIDGGNVVRWNHAAILTDKAFNENTRHEPSVLRQRLRRLLEVDRLVVIPTEPDDKVGHADGMVRFLDATTLLVNDYSHVAPAFGRRLDVALRLKGFKIIPFPYAPTDQPGPDPDIWPAIGVYINFLQTKDIIVCPTFGLPEDDQALSVLSRCFPTQKIIPLRCPDLAMGGGVLNCVTWTVKTGAK